MSRFIRVKLDFTIELDHDVKGISDEWADIPWALTVCNAVDHKGLGIQRVVRADRTLSVVDEKGKVR